MTKPIAFATSAVVGLAALGLATGSLHAAINSNLTIKKGKTFLLGGSQPDAFRVRGTNTGPFAVAVFARKDSEDTAIATVTPGSAFDQSFAKGEIAVFRNTSNARDAVVKVRVTGYTRNLGMSYEGDD